MRGLFVALLLLFSHSGPIFCDPMDYNMPGFPVLHIFCNLPKFMSFDLVMPFIHLILYCPLLLLPSIFPRSGSFLMSWLFASGGQSIGVSASASVLPANIQDWFPLGLTGLISLQFRALKSLLQHHSSKASILQRSAFFMAQLSHSYMTTGEAIDLTIWIFVDKICLCFLIHCLGLSYLSFKGLIVF